MAHRHILRMVWMDNKMSQMPEGDAIVTRDMAECHECKQLTRPLTHRMCRDCAARDMAKRLGAGVLDLPADWYEDDSRE